MLILGQKNAEKINVLVNKLLCIVIELLYDIYINQQLWRDYENGEYKGK